MIHVTNLLDRLRRRGGSALFAERVVAYDGLCPLCIRSVALIRALNWPGNVRFWDLEDKDSPANPKRDDFEVEQLRLRMHVFRTERQPQMGFDAVRDLMRCMPLAWPLLFLLYLPGVPRLGRRLYDHVATRRTRRACPEGSCRRGHSPEDRA